MINKNQKIEIFAKLRTQVEENLKEVLSTQKATQDGATHAENKAENDKDMRSTEASYLARGLAQRVATLQDTNAQLVGLEIKTFNAQDIIAATALVCLLDEDEKESLYLLLPTAGGEKISYQNKLIKAITPTSPLGEELIGRKVGDDFEVDLPGGRVSFQIAWVA
jgi:transcription elongation GreA/GreB family factor